ncbi:LETM1-related biofilm-associated protein [Flavobacterium sp.]|uniref:LETM1-related biofilm-associated protein n=1 Tax=Flavobacterium sp. TaxID=239 RepID=UPI00261F1682|nr:LETM1-related biofilm-associated protein [Flavobacterium sp.]MDD3004598.1 LETM1-related biofilm-associated protein [Flavobacterium sp.]
MINASAIGWIDKFFQEQGALETPLFDYPETFYKRIRATGFIYGHIISFDTPTPINTKGWTDEEISKVALLSALFATYQMIRQDVDSRKFIAIAVQFYKKIHPETFNLFKKILPGDNESQSLEKLISERVKTNENIISKNFSHIVTNALLFEDILGFMHYLRHNEIPDNYFKKLEEAIISLVTLALTTKLNPTKFDDLLIKLFEASVRFTKFYKVNVQNLETLPLDYFSSVLERYYLIDMAGLALWSDEKIEQNEASFLYKLAELMKIEANFVAQSINDTDLFIQLHKKDIPYFNYSNPVKHFYDQATQSVIVLITRNKNRLLKEISQSGELMVLLAHSTQRDLDEKEKKKVKKQLLDICKSIPSLTIFLLPGGSLLLPILIKFIPKLLPSAFNENLE